MQGASGLDYAGVRAWLDEQAFDADTRKEYFDGICAAERATLQGWAEQRKSNTQG